MACSVVRAPLFGQSAPPKLSASRHLPPAAAWARRAANRRPARRTPPCASYEPTQDNSPQLLCQVPSTYNLVQVIKVPWEAPEVPDNLRDSRILTLDTTGAIHSVYYPSDPTRFTDSYWDYFALLPSVLPRGASVALLGLGCGTLVHLYNKYWRSHDLKLEGWELDEEVVKASREFLGLRDLEDNGLLVHIGDALGPDVYPRMGLSNSGTSAFTDVRADEKFDALVIDLFGDGKLIKQLDDPETWASLRSRVKPDGKIFANLGEESAGKLPLAAMLEGCGGTLSICKLANVPTTVSSNVLAISSPESVTAGGRWNGVVPAGLEELTRAPWQDA